MATGSTYSLGPLPWPDQAVIDAVWKHSSEVSGWIDQHPGSALSERIESLKAVMKIFRTSAGRFAAGLDEFHEAAEGGAIFHRNRKNELNSLEDMFREQLYVFSSTAMTLVDQARALSAKVEIPGYRERVDAEFVHDPQHRFIQDLRIDVIHISLHRPAWRTTAGKKEKRTARFMLWRRQLKRQGEYHRLAREYLKQHADGIDIGEMMSSYAERVVKFHDWLVDIVSMSSKALILEYQHYRNLVTYTTSRPLWTMLLKQVIIDGKRNPFNYLDKYLTTEELQKVSSIPHGTKDQVDLIIEYIDETGMCDQSLRQLAYEAFGIR